MAAGVAELQGAGKKEQWKAVLVSFTNSISEGGKTIPGFEDICAVNSTLGLKSVKAHVSKALEKCGAVGLELEHKLTSFQRVKEGLQDLAAGSKEWFKSPTGARPGENVLCIPKQCTSHILHTISISYTGVFYTTPVPLPGVALARSLLRSKQRSATQRITQHKDSPASSNRQ